MKINIKEAIELSAVFLQLENVLQLLNDGGTNLSEEELLQAQKELDMLLRCSNLVVQEIACEYIHLKTYETFTTDNGHIDYCDFNRQPVDIYAVKKDGKNCRFKLYPSELITSDGEVQVYFTYMPEKVDINGSLDFEEGKISTRVISYGTVAEYCIISGMYEESCIWDKRYKDSLFAGIKSLKAITLPERRWA